MVWMIIGTLQWQGIKALKAYIDNVLIGGLWVTKINVLVIFLSEAVQIVFEFLTPKITNFRNSLV